MFEDRLRLGVASFWSTLVMKYRIELGDLRCIIGSVSIFLNYVVRSTEASCLRSSGGIPPPVLGPEGLESGILGPGSGVS